MILRSLSIWDTFVDNVTKNIICQLGNDRQVVTSEMVHRPHCTGDTHLICCRLGGRWAPGHSAATGDPGPNTGHWLDQADTRQPLIITAYTSHSPLPLSTCVALEKCFTKIKPDTETRVLSPNGTSWSNMKNILTAITQVLMPDKTLDNMNRTTHCQLWKHSNSWKKQDQEHTAVSRTRFQKCTGRSKHIQQCYTVSFNRIFDIS